jgi:hypothetical protein
MSVACPPGGGTRFRIELPLVAQLSEADLAAAAGAAGPTPPSRLS